MGHFVRRKSNEARPSKASQMIWPLDGSGDLVNSLFKGVWSKRNVDSNKETFCNCFTTYPPDQKPLNYEFTTNRPIKQLNSMRSFFLWLYLIFFVQVGPLIQLGYATLRRTSMWHCDLRMMLFTLLLLHIREWFYLTFRMGRRGQKGAKKGREMESVARDGNFTVLHQWKANEKAGEQPVKIFHNWI